MVRVNRVPKFYSTLLYIGLLVYCLASSVGAQKEQELSHEIQVSELEELVTTEGGLAVLKKDYHNVSTGQRKSWMVASKPENLPKNRYDDLLAYDETRVVLALLPDDPNSDYINANYMDGYHRQNEYVATQGPLLHTINDFWRMIWQLNSRKIVMLANVIEHGKEKVAKYWPDKNGTYGQFFIQKLSQHNVSTSQQVYQKFLLKNTKNGEARVVRHFHYTGWADFGVPEDKMAVVSMVEQAKKLDRNDEVPLVVHCSAGIGRTGTVILTDTMLERARSENKVDFLKRLNHMRDQRVDVVEKEGQYIFAHEAVNDAMTSDKAKKYLESIDSKYQEFELLDENNNIISEPLTGYSTSGAAKHGYTSDLVSIFHSMFRMIY